MRAVRMSPTLPLVLALSLAGPLAPARASAQEGVVRAVLFYSPTCPHCHKVMTEDLPPLADRYGDRLVIVGVDVTSPTGQELLRTTAEHFGIAAADVGVPLMVVGDEVLMGAREIPERLPGIIERALARDGIDWPQVASLRQALAANGLVAEEPGGQAAGDAPPADTAAATEAPTPPPGSAGREPTAPAPPAPAAARTNEPTAPADTATSGGSFRAQPSRPRAVPAEETPSGITRSLTPAGTDARPSALERLLRDPLGNGVALAVLLGLVLALVVSVRRARAPATGPAPLPAWLVPTLAVAGMGVAAYLSFVELTGRSAVCGPVGDCNAVQQSPYARLFGVLPVGLLGLFGYAAILGAWSFGRGRPGPVREGALRFRWAMAFVATAFSVYLTFLEPFVIGATCVWCITSSVLIGLLLLVTTTELRAPADA